MTWEQLKDGLRYLISQSSEGAVEVSKLKVLFRTELQTELSETVFGHCSLSKLLRDPDLGPEFHLSSVASKNQVHAGRLFISLGPADSFSEEGTVPTLESSRAGNLTNTYEAADSSVTAAVDHDSGVSALNVANPASRAWGPRHVVGVLAPKKQAATLTVSGSEQSWM